MNRAQGRVDLVRAGFPIDLERPVISHTMNGAPGKMDSVRAEFPSDPEHPDISFDEPWCYDSDPESDDWSDDTSSQITFGGTLSTGTDGSCACRVSSRSRVPIRQSDDPRAMGRVISIEVDHHDERPLSTSQATTARSGEEPPRTACPKSAIALSAWKAARHSEERGLGSQHNDFLAGSRSSPECAVLEEQYDDEALMADAVRTIKIALDSGAGNHVAGPEDVEGFKIQPSKASKKGLGFIAANGARIPNLGEAGVGMKEQRGGTINSVFQIAEVSRPLYSVSKICDEGCDVHFCASHAWITKGDVEIARFPREQGLYVAEMMLQPPDKDAVDASGFARQGAKK